MQPFAFQADKSTSYIVFEKLIGKGQFGRVHMGLKYDQKNSTLLAVKLLDKKHTDDCYQFFFPEESKKIQNSIDREAYILSKTQNENILKLYHFEEDDLYYYLFLEYCDNNLEKYLNENAPINQYDKYLDQNDIIDKIKQISNAIYYLEQINICHRDLKPENILLLGNQIKIGDFGSAKPNLQKFQPPTELRGTKEFMPPESFIINEYTQEQQMEISRKHDIWSLGIILYRMIYNEYPYQLRDKQTPVQIIDVLLNGEEVKAKKGEIAREVCDDLKFLMEKMLKKDYKERISWTELIETNIMKSEYSIERMSLFSNKTNIIKYQNVQNPSLILQNMENMPLLKPQRNPKRQITTKESQNYHYQMMFQERIESMNQFILLYEDLISKLFDCRQYFMILKNHQLLKNNEEFDEFVLLLICPVFFEQEKRLANQLENNLENLLKSKKYEESDIEKYIKSPYHQQLLQKNKCRKDLHQYILQQNPHYDIGLDKFKDLDIVKIFKRTLHSLIKYLPNIFQIVNQNNSGDKTLLLFLIMLSFLLRMESLAEMSDVNDLNQFINNFAKTSIPNLKIIITTRWTRYNN